MATDDARSRASRNVCSEMHCTAPTRAESGAGRGGGYCRRLGLEQRNAFPKPVSGPKRGHSGNGNSGNMPFARSTSTLDPCARRACSSWAKGLMQYGEFGGYPSLCPLRSCPPCSASRASRCALAACGGASPLDLQTCQPPAGAQQTAAEEELTVPGKLIRERKNQTKVRARTQRAERVCVRPRPRDQGLPLVRSRCRRGSPRVTQSSPWPLPASVATRVR